MNYYIFFWTAFISILWDNELILISTRLCIWYTLNSDKFINTYSFQSAYYNFFPSGVNLVFWKIVLVDFKKIANFKKFIVKLNLKTSLTLQFQIHVIINMKPRKKAKPQDICDIIETINYNDKRYFLIPTHSS